MSVMSSGRGSVSGDRIWVMSNVAVATATVRLRVSGSVMFIVTTVGIGAVVCVGTSTKDVEVSEIICGSCTAVPDKIGISIGGYLMSVMSCVADGDEVGSSVLVVVS